MARAGLVVREAVSISCAGPRKLKEVVGGADHRPLRTHFLDTAHEELPEPSCRLDLPEHRLDNLLPEPVWPPPAAPFDPSFPRLGQQAEGPAAGGGAARRGLGCLPGFLRPGAGRLFLAAASARAFSSAAALASASSAALASRILASRLALSATQSGSSSPRLSLP